MAENLPMNMRARAWIAPLLLVCLTTACLATRALEPPDSARLKLILEVKDMLDERARQLTLRNVEGFLAPLDTHARETEMPIAKGYLEIPATQASFRLLPSSIPGSKLPLAGVQTRLEYRFKDLPADNVFSIPITYDLVATGNQLRIAVSEPAANLLPIWATGPVQFTHSDHFIALYRPGLAGVEQTLAVAEAARAALQGSLPTPLDQTSLIVLAKDEDEFSRAVYQPFPSAETRSAQFASTIEVNPGDVLVEGRQIVVNIRKLNEDKTGPETFRHELGHLDLATRTRPITPGWVAEGAAMYLAGTRPVATWRRGVKDGSFDRITFEQLSRSPQLGGVDPAGDTATSEYAYAAAATWYLVEKFGADRFWEFYRSFAAVPAKKIYDLLPSGGPATGARDAIAELGVQTTSNSLRTLYGLTPAGLDLATRNWIKGQTGGS
jgi:hypothetical protein